MNEIHGLTFKKEEAQKRLNTALDTLESLGLEIKPNTVQYQLDQDSSDDPQYSKAVMQAIKVYFKALKEYRTFS